jgi:hypothetical protein
VESVAVVVAVVLIVGISGYLIGNLVASIRHERRSSGVRKIWANFGLSITFAILFILSLVGQGITEWQLFVDEQDAHDQAATAGGFLVEFGQSTLENWQSEFLQLFSFVVLAALLIHRGSAESKDGTDRIERKLDELGRRLDELTPSRSSR